MIVNRITLEKFINKVVDWFSNFDRRQQNKALEKFIGQVSDSAELEEKIRQWERLQRKQSGIAFF